MTVLFVWDERYSVNNPELDGQHQQMFELGNSLDGKLSSQEIRKIIMGLYKYIRHHFHFEERVMQEIEYPKINAHKKLHNDLIEKLDKASLKPFNSEQSVFAFKKFIYEWINVHILNHDMDYVRYFKEKS